ncbi:CDP-glycerol glycerophosphotransferase family protein [Aeromicrobium stalagmiti]|uniref:CDP-glycerol glycerophosphotransferase family protein n=1 Tax=Aeromicrobium stalagmiti TaxID=2738988 RepID=UPI00156A16D8|nr:CDP-glycerol glycerophosphotransferase family protein [Aeromicrobium stalagmiti]
MTAEPVRIIAASLHGLDVVDGGRTLRLTGTCRRPGTDAAGPPADQTLTLHWSAPDGTAAVSAVTEPRLRYEDGAYRWTGFVGDVPIDQIPVGTTGVEIELTTPAGEPSRVVVNAAPGALATSRPIIAAGRRLQLLPSLSERAEVVTQAFPAALAGFRWATARTVRAVRDLVHRRPYAFVQPLRLLTKPFFIGREIWLVGERADTARDNGFHFFSYLRRERPDIRAYYVLDPSSDRFAELSQLGRVVRHSSWRHRILMVHATVLANAYSVKHMVPSRWKKQHYMRQLNWRIGAYRVYLKHGINDKTKDVRRRTGGYDLFLTASPAESDAVRLASGYDHQVAETGLPRFDALVPTPRSRTILYMPTWRRYLAPELFSQGGAGETPFEGSTYQQFVDGLLTSERLQALLEQHDHRFELMPHYNLRAQYADPTIGGDRVTILDGGASDIQEVMRRCDLFLTDYSSVHFDLAYLGTPMVYTHFDRDEFTAGHAEPSWFDHERDGFGPVTYDLDTTIDALQRYLETGCVREPEYDERARRAFTFHDRDNSRRAVEAVEQLVRSRGIS